MTEHKTYGHPTVEGSVTVIWPEGPYASENIKTGDTITSSDADVVHVNIDIPEHLYTPWPETYGYAPIYDTGSFEWPPTREWMVGEHTTESIMPKADYERLIGSRTDDDAR